MLKHICAELGLLHLLQLEKVKVMKIPGHNAVSL